MKLWAVSPFVERDFHPHQHTTWVLLRPNDLEKHNISQVATSPSTSRNQVVTQTSQSVVNPMIIHSPIQHVVNIVVTNLLTHSRMVTPQPRVIVQQIMVTIPPYGVTLPQLTTVVVQHPPPSMWTPQVKNPFDVPFQSIVGSVDLFSWM